MKIEAFQTLAAVVGKGSFAAAAQAMHMTPSAVSMQMKQLEQYLGRPLFDRSGQQIRVRPAALELVAVMAPALNALAQMRRGTATAIEGHLQVGIIEGLQPLLLPQIISYLREHYPRLDISPQRGTSMMLTEEVKAGRLDAAIAARPQRGTQTGLHWIPLTRQGLVFIAPPVKGGVSGVPRRLGAAELKQRIRDLEWIRYDRATSTGSLATKYVHKLVPGKRSLMELGSAAAIAAMVSAGLGFSVLQLIDTGLVRQYPFDVFQLPKDGPVFELCALMRSSDADDRLLSAWLEAVKHALAMNQSLYSPEDTSR